MLSLQATVRAVVPAARGLPLPTVGAMLALAATPALATVARGGDSLQGTVVAATVIGAGAVAFSCDDPSGATLAAMPVTLLQRRLLRLLAVLAGLVGMWLLVALVVTSSGSSQLDRLDVRAAEAAACSGLALALAGAGERRGVPSASAAGALFGPLALLFLSSLAYRHDLVPAIGSSSHHLRWWPIAVAAWAGAAWSSRDPMR